ncbi:ribonuclease H-like domain-containing protein [Tanacetum coccineum]
MSTPVNTSSTDSQMHNNIMAAGSKDRPPMLGPGRYSQWRSRFLRYIDTKPNGGGLKKCILNGPYVPTSVLIQAVPEAEENKEHFQSEKEAIFLLLTGIGDEIYSTVDACNTANEMWIAIERLQQGESLNVQDVKTNLFWEFGKFTSRDGESMESYYSRFYKLMNELTRNNLQVTTMQILTIKELKPQRSNATSSSKRPSASTRHKGKEIAKPITPQSESVSVSDEDSDPEQAQRDKEMQKNLALLAKYFKKLYKPTNNNLRTSSNSRNKTEDTTPRYNNDNQSRQFGNQRTMTVAGARETVGSQVVQQTGIQCFNCKGYGHYAKECRKPKRVKDYAYHKEKMMMCKQAEQGVPLQAEQADWLEDTDEEIDEQELEAHYSYMAKIQDVSPEGTSSTGQPLEQVQNQNESNVYDNVRRHSEQPESINDTYVLEKDDSNVTPDSSNICTNDNQVDQNAAECVDERAALANLIANLTLDTEENKTILKQLKKATHHYSEMGKNKQNEFEKYKAFNDRTIDYEILQTKLNETLGLLALKGHWITGEKDIDKMIGNGQTVKVFELNCLYSVSVNRTIHMLAPKCSRHNNGRPTFANPRYLKKAQSEKPCLYEIPFDTSDPANRFAPEREETTTLDNESRSKLNKDYVKPYDYTKQNSLYEIYYKATLNWRYLISWKTRKGS